MDASMHMANNDDNIFFFTSVKSPFYFNLGFVPAVVHCVAVINE